MDQEMQDEEMTAGTFPSLEDHCLLYIITHITDFSEETLAQLPLHLRLSILKYVAPIHLCWLEQTKVAEGIDTDPIWQTFYDVVFHRNTWAVVYPDECIYTQPLRDLYLQYVFSRLQNHFDRDRVVRRAEIALFGLFRERLPAGMYSLLEFHGASRHRSQDRKIGKEYDCFVAGTRDTWDYPSVVSTLTKFRAFPIALDIPITPLTLRQDVMELLLQALSVSKVKSLTIKNPFTTKQHDQIFVSLVDTLMKQDERVLRVLKLHFVSGKALCSIARHFVGPDGYNGLKEVSIFVSGNTSHEEAYVPLLSSMLVNQTTLEGLVLEGDWLNSGMGVNLIAEISTLYNLPTFQHMHIQTNREVPQSTVCCLVEAFLRAKCPEFQELRLHNFVMKDDITPPHLIPEEVDDIRKTPMSYETSGRQLLELLDKAMRAHRRDKMGLVKEDKYQSLRERPVKYRKFRREDLAKHLEKIIEDTKIADSQKEKQKVRTQAMKKFKEAELAKKKREKKAAEEKAVVKDMASMKLSSSSASGSDNTAPQDSADTTAAAKSDTTQETQEEKMEVDPLLAQPVRNFDEPVLDIDREFMEIYGPRKLLMFDTVRFSRSFLRWFNSQPYVCLLGLEIEACRVAGKRSLDDYFTDHTEFHVEHYYCSYGNYDDDD